jgi:hypothetical protein
MTAKTSAIRVTALARSTSRRKWPLQRDRRERAAVTLPDARHERHPEDGYQTDGKQANREPITHRTASIRGKPDAKCLRAGKVLPALNASPGVGLGIRELLRLVGPLVGFSPPELLPVE